MYFVVQLNGHTEREKESLNRTCIVIHYRVVPHYEMIEFVLLSISTFEIQIQKCQTSLIDSNKFPKKQNPATMSCWGCLNFSRHSV